MIYIYNLFILAFTLFYSTDNFAGENDTIIADAAVYQSYLYPIGDKVHSQTECYTILKELGEGAFGRVYAVKNEDGKKFALKCHKQQHHEGDHIFSDAEREYHRGQILNHPNIIKSFELFDSYVPMEGNVMSHLVLELVDGKTLGKWECHSLTRRQSLKAVSQFLKAIEYAFSLDLMHWDLHGENVMIDKNLNFRIIDLASFYSFEELFEGIKEASNKSQLAQGAIDKKLKEILRKNARLQAHLKQIYHQKQLLENHKFFFKQKKQQAMVQKSPPKHSPLCSEYFYCIVSMCKMVIFKSNCYEENDSLTLEMDQLAMQYIKDIELQKELYFQDYLALLMQLIETELGYN